MSDRDRIIQLGYEIERARRVLREREAELDSLLKSTKREQRAAATPKAPRADGTRPRLANGEALRRYKEAIAVNPAADFAALSLAVYGEDTPESRRKVNTLRYRYREKIEAEKKEGEEATSA